MDKLLNVIVGVINNQHQHILIAKRPTHLHCGGLWEFPGGKIKLEETDQQALQRELKEELNISVKQSSYLTTITHHYPDLSVELRVWRVNDFSGEASGMEQQEIRWVPIKSLKQYHFPEANSPILQLLCAK